VSAYEVSRRGRDSFLGFGDEATTDRCNRTTAGAHDVLVVLLVKLIACLAVSEFDPLEGAHPLQMLERAEDRRRVGRNTALSKGLVYLVKGPPVPITFGKERGYGISDVARTRHTRIIHFFTSDLQNLGVYGRPSDAVSKTIVFEALLFPRFKERIYA
jgi:hypothetical protein